MDPPTGVEQRIVLAARRLVEAQGWRRANSTREARAAGVAQTEVLRAYADRGRLLLAMLTCRVHVPLPHAPEDPPHELARWAWAQLTCLCEHRTLLRRTIAELDDAPELRDGLRELQARTSEELLAYLARLAARDALSVDHPQAVVAVFMGALFADAVSRDLFPDRYTYTEREGAEAYARLLLSALGYRAATNANGRPEPPVSEAPA